MADRDLRTVGIIAVLMLICFLAGIGVVVLTDDIEITPQVIEVRIVTDDGSTSLGGIVAPSVLPTVTPAR